MYRYAIEERGNEPNPASALDSGTEMTQIRSEDGRVPPSHNHVEFPDSNKCDLCWHPRELHTENGYCIACWSWYYQNGVRTKREMSTKSCLKDGNANRERSK